MDTAKWFRSKREREGKSRDEGWERVRWRKRGRKGKRESVYRIRAVGFNSQSHLDQEVSFRVERRHCERTETAGNKDSWIIRR